MRVEAKERLCNLIINPKKMGDRALGELPSSNILVSNTIRFGWPSLLDAFLAALVSLIDMQMVSCLGIESVSAIGLTTQPRLIVFCFFFAMNFAITAVVARRFGQKDRRQANLALNQALLVSCIAGVVLSALVWYFARPILLFAGAQVDTIDNAVTYLKVIMVGLPFCAVTANINAGQRAVGRTKLTMVTNVTANVINLILNYLLIEGHFGFPAWGIYGAGFATATGWVVAFLIAMFSLLRKSGYLRFSLKDMFSFKEGAFRPLAKVFGGAYLEQLCLRVGFFIVAFVVAKLGTVSFGIHNIVINLITITFAIGDGLSVASSALVGQSLGRKRSDMAELYAKCCQRIGTYLGLVCMFIFIVFGKSIFWLFDKTGAIVPVGYQILLLASIVVILQICQVITNGSLRGAGDVVYVAKIMLISVAIVRPSTAYIFAFVFNFQLYGIWIGFLFDQFLRFTLSGIRFKKGKWKDRIV